MKSNDVTRLAVAAAVDHVVAMANDCGGTIVEVPLPDDDGAMHRHAVSWRDVVGRAKGGDYEPAIKLLVLATAMARHGHSRIANDTWRRMVSRLHVALWQYGLHRLQGDIGSDAFLAHRVRALYNDAADAAMTMALLMAGDDDDRQATARMPEVRATLLFTFMYGAPMYAHAMGIEATDTVLSEAVRAILDEAKAIYSDTALLHAVREAHRTAPPDSIGELSLMADRAWRIAQADGEGHGSAIALFVEPLIETCNLRGLPVYLDG